MKYCHEGEEANKLLREAAKAAAIALPPKIMKNCTSLEVHEVRLANKSLRESAPCLTYVEGGAVDGCARCGLARNQHPTAKAAAKASAPKSKYTHCQEWVLRQAAKAALNPNAPLAERKVIVTHEEKWSIWLSKKDKEALWKGLIQEGKAKAKATKQKAREEATEEGKKKKQKTREEVWEESIQEALKAKEKEWEAAWSGKAAKAEEGKEVTQAEEAWLEAVEAEEARRR